MRSRARREHLAHLVVLAALVDQLLRAGGVVGRAAPLLGELGGRLEPAVLAPGLRVAVAVGDHLGVDDLRRQLGEARLDLLDERLDHRVTRLAARVEVGAARVSRRRARRSPSRRSRGAPRTARHARPRPHPRVSPGARGSPSPTDAGIALAVCGSVLAGCGQCLVRCSSPRSRLACGRCGAVRRDRVCRAADERRDRQRAELPGRATRATCASSCSRRRRSRVTAGRSSFTGGTLFAPDLIAHGASAAQRDRRQHAVDAGQPVAGQRPGDRRAARSRSRPSPTPAHRPARRPRSTRT